VLTKEEIDEMELDTTSDPELAAMFGEKTAELPVDGDLKVFAQSDAAGRFAISGGHANAGYSGYFKASIYADKGWRLFEIRSVVPQTSYARQLDKADVLANIRAEVAKAAGRLCSFSEVEGGKRGRYAVE
jgi:hypothetical protein